MLSEKLENEQENNTATAAEEPQTTADIPLDKEDLKLLQRLSASLERSKVNAYIDMMEKPSRWLWTNFFGGIVRGLGMAIGFTILGAVLFFVLRSIVEWNLPGISNLLGDILELVESYQK